MDAADAAGKVSEAVVKVRAAEAQASSDRTRRLAMLRLIMNGAAVVLVLLIAAYFGRAARVLGSKLPVSMAQMLKDLPPPVKSGSPAMSMTAAASIPTPSCRAGRAVAITRRAEVDQSGGRGGVVRGSRARARRPRRAGPARTDGDAVRRQGCRALGRGHGRRHVAAHAVPRLLGQGAGEAETPAGRFGQRDFTGVPVAAAPVHQWRISQ